MSRYSPNHWLPKDYERDPAVAPVISTTYDEVLFAYIRANTAAVRLEYEADALRSSGLGPRKLGVPTVALDDVRKRLDTLEIMLTAQVYVPEVRWNLLKVANWISLRSYSTCVEALIDVMFVIVDVNYCRNDYRHLIE